MMRLTYLTFIIVLFTGILIISVSGAQGQIVINSGDWQDVYLGSYYAGLSNNDSKFVISSEQSSILLPMLDRKQTNMLLIESDKTPIVFNYQTSLESAGFNVEKIVLSGTSLNIELAKRANTKKFLILDGTYGYNAISVAPYAAREKFFVIFANRNNIDELYSYLNTNGVEMIIIYGYLDNEVKTRLAEFNPVTINKGSRFDNNIELLKRYKNITRVILTNGEFIENSLLSGKEPILFLGKDRIPDQVVEYLRESGIKNGLVIGTELSGAGHLLKEKTNMTIFLKFGQGFGDGGSSAIKSLDMFPLPKYELEIDINSVNYNRATKELEVTYENKGNTGAYLSSSIEILSSGVRITTIGDKESVYVNRGSSLTVGYETELNGQNLTAKFTTMFGELPGSFERMLYKEMNIEMIELFDNSLLNISKVSYDKGAHKIKVEITNIGAVRTNAKTQIKFVIYGEERIMTQEKAILLEPGKSKDAVFITTLSDTNIEENPSINVRVNYGERESALIKVIEGNYPLEIVSDYTILIIVVVLIIVVIIIWIQKKKKQTKDIEKSKEENKVVQDAKEIAGQPEESDSTEVPVVQDTKNT
ncbi:MAG: hypothetical protein OIN83_10805 [Candidatus Methanoperedens sp.]|nr:hypothetical protein [Candidatus Methanoperedens sp.]